MRAQTDIDLLMIGKTGSGKSALGNSILKRKHFLSMSSQDSVTTELSYEVTNHKNKIIKVVDGPGVGDTRLDTRKSIDLVSNEIARAILLNPRGYHAFLLVVKFGGRFTPEDQDTVKFLKSLFGPDFVQKYCILVMTGGDNFERDSEDTGLTFEQWCARERGVFRELMTECCGRIVLFNNFEREEGKRDAQIDRLLETISNLQSHGHRYTDKSFEQAAVMREEALVKSKKAVIQEETLQEVSLILQKLNEEKLNFSADKSVAPLHELSTRCGKLIEHVREEDKGTGALRDLEEKVKALKKSVDDAILVHHTAVDERKKMEEKERHMKQLMEEELQRRKQQMQEMKAQMDEDIKRQRKHNEEMMAQQLKVNEQIQTEVGKRQKDIEDAHAAKWQRALEDFEVERKRNEEKFAMEKRASQQEVDNIIAEAQAQMVAQAQTLGDSYKEVKKTSAAEVMMKVMGYTAFAAGHVLAPELMAVLWLGSSMWAAYTNK